MSDTITTSLGLDASQAISALNAADAATVKYTTTLNSLAGAMSRVGTASSAVEAFGSRTSSSLNAASSAAQDFSNKMSRIEALVSSRLISQGINMARTALEESITSAIHLGNELQRISTMTGVDSQTLGQQVRYLAEASAISLESATAAMTAAWRANVGGMREAHALMDEATLLGKATGAEPSAAVSAVGAVIRGLNLDVGSAKKISDEMLTISQKTRVGVDELGSAFGRVAPLARHLGISFEDVAATLATAVNEGQSVGTAMGVMERTMKSLVTPSVTMSAALKDMGASSATSLIAAKGWGEALQAIAGTTAGTAEEIMKLGKGVRGASDIMTIGTDSASKYNEILNQIKNTKPGAAAEAAASQMESAAGRVEAAGTRIKNTLINVGDKVLTILSPVSQALPWDKFAEGLTASAVAAIPMFAGKFLGGSRFQAVLAGAQDYADKRAAQLGKARADAPNPTRKESEWNRRRAAADQAASDALAAEGSTSEAYQKAAAARELTYSRTDKSKERALDRVAYLEQETAAANRTATAYKVLGGTIRFAGLATMAAGAGYIIGSGFNDRMAQIKTDIAEAAAHWLESRRAADQKLMDADNEAVNQKIAKTLNASSAIMASYENQAENAREEAQEEIRTVDDKLKQMLSAHQEYVKGIVSAEKEAYSEIDNGYKRIGALEDKAKEDAFKHVLETQGNPLEQMHLLEGNAKKTADEARRTIEEGARTGDKDEIARGRAEFATAVADAKQAASIAKAEAEKHATTPDEKAFALKTNRDYTSALSWVQKIGQEEMSAERAVISLHRQHVSQLEQEKAIQEQTTAAIKAQVDIATKNSKILDKQGNLLPENERKQMAERRQAALGELDRLGFNQGDKSRADQLGLGKQFAEDYLKQPKQLSISIEESLSRIPARIDNLFASYKARLQIDIGGLEAALGRPIKNAADLTEGLKAVGTQLKDFGAHKAAMKGFNDQIGAAQAAMQATVDLANQPGYLGMMGIRQALTSINDQPAIDKIAASMLSLSKNAQISVADLEKVRDQVNALGADSYMSTAGTRLWVKDFATLLEKLLEIRSVRQQMKDAEGTKSQSDSRSNLNDYYKQVLDNSPGGKADNNPYSGIVNGIDSVGAAALSTSQKLERMNALIQQESSAPTPAAQQVLNAPSAGDVINNTPHRFGGFLASGGEPRGVDQIPIMAAKGEFVVNAESARRFSTQLQAMNAGSRPNYHNQGGSLTNVGDITVNMHTGGYVGASTGRQIAVELRRELRRGSASLS